MSPTLFDRPTGVARRTGATVDVRETHAPQDEVRLPGAGSMNRQHRAATCRRACVERRRSPAPFDHVFDRCPVAQPRGFGDGFGAPRGMRGGYHLHKGVDIVAPMGPRSTRRFAGHAYTSSNGLGGSVVFVVGQQGKVYNAHLSSYSDNSNSAVSAGEVIGYVGTRGTAPRPTTTSSSILTRCPVTGTRATTGTRWSRTRSTRTRCCFRPAASRARVFSSVSYPEGPCDLPTSDMSEWSGAA